MRAWRWRNALSTAGPPAILALCALFLFREILRSGKCLYGSDFVLQFYAWKGFVYDHLWSHGSLPLWNPYLFSGSPFIANVQASMFYPLGFFYYLLPPEQAYVYSTIMHCVLGSIFMYLFMRSILISPRASCFSAIVFIFNGYFMAHVYAGHLSFVQNYVWIPLIFFFLYRFVQRNAWVYAVAAGFVLGVQILGGFPQIAFYTILSSTLYLVFHGLRYWKEQGLRGASRFAVGITFLLLTGFGLAAIQVLPTLEFTWLSTRGRGISYAMATYESFHPKEVMAFLIPDIFGNAVDQTYWRSQEFWHFWESCGYIGILPLLLIFIREEQKQSVSVRIFWIILIFVSLFLALGKYNPFYPLVYRLPGFRSFRLPTQIIFLYVFGMAVLAGLGLDTFLRNPWKFGKGFLVFSTLAGGVLLTFVIGLYFSRFSLFLSLFKNFSEGPVPHVDMTLLYERMSHGIEKASLLFFASLFLLWFVKRRKLSPACFGTLACAIVFIDLYLFGAQFIRIHTFVTSTEKQSILSQLSRTPAEGRVVTTEGNFKTNDGLQYRFPSVLGYDPLILKRYADYVLSSQGYPPNEHVVNLSGIHDPEAKLLKLLNVRQVVSAGRVLPLENEIPYAHIVHHAVTPSQDNVLDTMKSERFDPLKTVILKKEDLERSGISSGVEGTRDFCEVLAYANERVTLRTSSDSAGYLVVSEIFYPGWTALVDGRTRDMMCGNYLFRVIPLEKGNHEVTLYFVSWPFRVGGVITLVTLVSSACLLWLLRRRRRDIQG